MTIAGQGHCDIPLIPSLINDQNLDYSQLGPTNHVSSSFSFPSDIQTLAELVFLLRSSVSKKRPENGNSKENYRGRI